MKPKAVQYTKTYVARAIRACEESNRPIAEFARDLGVEYGTLYHWMKKAGKTKRRVGPPDPPAPPPTLAPAAGTLAAAHAEIERLKHELDEANKKLEFAKKAAAFFAKQHE